jgi:hypothetical protein
VRFLNGKNSTPFYIYLCGGNSFLLFIFVVLTLFVGCCFRTGYLFCFWKAAKCVVHTK